MKRSKYNERKIEHCSEMCCNDTDVNCRFLICLENIAASVKFNIQNNIMLNSAA